MPITEASATMSEGDSTSKFGYRPGDRVVPGYRLEEMLGGGNFGEVWKAIGPGRVRAALKILDLSGLPGKVERRALDRIRDIVHPNLVSIFGIWSINREGGVVEDATSSASLSQAATATTATVAFDPTKLDAATRLVIAMQLGGKSLFARLEECQAEGKRGIPCKELLGYMQDAARGIDYLNEEIHDLGNGPVSIVHCDIKPQNLLLVGGGVQVCDYSLIRPVEDVQKTAMGGSCTPAYAAPELHVSKPCVSSDQYCLAMSYVELRTGKLPFPPETKLTDLFYVKYEKRLDFTGLTPPVVEVLRRATNPDANARFASCCEMVEALRQAEALHETAPRWFPPRIKISGKAWRRASAAFLAAAVAAAAVAWYLFRPVPPTTIDQWIKSDQFERAFAYALSRREAQEDTDNRFKMVLAAWAARVESLGQQHDYKKAIEVLAAIPPTISDKDPDAKTQIEGARLHAWERLADDCIRPESLDAEQIAVVLHAKHVPADKQKAIGTKLSNELVRRYEQALSDSDLDMADRILKGVAGIVKTDNEVYTGLKFDLASQRARRHEMAFDYYKKAKKFRQAKALLADPDKTWPAKERNVQELADAWYADLTERSAEESAFRADDRIAEDIEAFLEFAPQHAGGQAVRILHARVRIRDQSYTVVEELKKLEKTALTPQQSLLLVELELICKDRETPGEAIGQAEGKALLNQIGKKLPPPGNQGSPSETQFLFSWEKNLYEETKGRLTNAPPLVEDPVAALDKALTPDAGLDGIDALIGKAEGRVSQAGEIGLQNRWKSELAVRRRIVVELKNHDRAIAENAANSIAQDDAKEKWRQFIDKFIPVTGPTVVPMPPDELLAAAIALLAKGELPTVRTKLAEIEKQIPGLSGESGNLWRHKVDLWKSMLVLAASQPPAAHLPEILAALKKTPDPQWVSKTISASQVTLICREVAVVEQCDDKAVLDESLALLWNILGSLRTKEKEILPVLERLFPKRIHLAVQEQSPSDASSKEVRERLESLNAIWKEIKGDITGENVVECRAWNVEYCIALHSGDEDILADALRDGMDLPAKSGAYVSYVRSLVSHENRKKTGKLLPAEWTAMLNDMGYVLVTKTSSGLTPERAERVRKWAADAVRELCKPKPGGDVFRTDFPLGNAAQIHALLKQLKADGMTLTADLQTAWAFAGLYKSPCDFGPAEDVLAAVDFRNGQADGKKRAREALPLLFAYLDRRLAGGPPQAFSAAEKTTVLGHAATFLRVFRQSRSNALSESEAKRIIESLLEPAVKLADKVETGEAGNKPLQSQRAGLYEAAFSITEDFSKVPWQDKSRDFADPKKRSARRAAILDSAILAARQGVAP